MYDRRKTHQVAYNNHKAQMRNVLRCKVLLIALLMATALPAIAADSDVTGAVEDAYRLCDAFKRSEMTTECSISGWSHRVDATMDVTGAQARATCANVVSSMATMNNRFNGRWQLRILSPYSGEKAIAVCTLR